MPAARKPLYSDRARASGGPDEKRQRLDPPDQKRQRLDPPDQKRQRLDPPDETRQRLGALGEQLALEHLERLGLTLLERNYRTRLGEIDLILHDDATLVFVEVKTASARAGVRPLERIDWQKRRRVRSIASAWLRERRDRPRLEVLRFDAVAVRVDGRGQLLSLEHLEGAF